VYIVAVDQSANPNFKLLN